MKKKKKRNLPCYLVKHQPDDQDLLVQFYYHPDQEWWVSVWKYKNKHDRDENAKKRNLPYYFLKHQQNI